MNNLKINHSVNFKHKNFSKSDTISSNTQNNLRNESTENISQSYSNALRNYNLALILFSSKKPFSLDEMNKESLTYKLKCSKMDLKSVLLAKELKYLLKNKFKEQNFLPGKNDINIKKGLFTVNLHNHTIYSDGKMKPKHVLNYAQDYAQKIKHPVYIAITDHNNLYGAKKALKLIAKNPNKYENIRFVPGIELRTKHTYNKNEPEKVAHLEILALGINPFDKKLNKYLDEHVKNINTEMEMDDLLKLLRNKNVILSLAHPGRISLPQGKNAEEFIATFKKLGGNAIEKYYSYEQYSKKPNADFIQIAKNADKYKLIKTGGRDCHQKNIFHRKDKMCCS